MRRPPLPLLLLAFAMLGCGKTEPAPAPKKAPVPAKVNEPAEKPWFSGTWTGSLELSEGPAPTYEKPGEKSKTEVRKSEPQKAEPVKPPPVQSSLQVLIDEKGDVALTIVEPALHCAGAVDNDVLRLRCAGPGASGTLIARKEETGRIVGNLNAAPHDSSKTWRGRVTLVRAETAL